MRVQKILNLKKNELVCLCTPISQFAFIKSSEKNWQFNTSAEYVTGNSKETRFPNELIQLPVDR